MVSRTTFEIGVHNLAMLRGPHLHQQLNLTLVSLNLKLALQSDVVRQSDRPAQILDLFLLSFLIENLSNSNLWTELSKCHSELFTSLEHNIVHAHHNDQINPLTGGSRRLEHADYKTETFHDFLDRMPNAVPGFLKTPCTDRIAEVGVLPTYDGCPLVLLRPLHVFSS